MTIHVIGAGLAGLAGALALARAGRPVMLHEATPQAGGRARALPDGTDNGTHALMGANRAALAFLATIGARRHWIEPEPAGLPVLDLADGTARRAALSPRAWLSPALRPPGLTAGALITLGRLALPGPERSVARAFAAHPRLHRALIEPLTIAALNTPADEASTRLLGAVLRRLGAPGATRLLVAERGLGPDLVAPALAALRLAGASFRTGARLRAIAMAHGRATALDFGEESIPLAAADAVLLATPPWESARLLPDLSPPAAYAPILNLHYARTGPGPVRFLGLLDALAQWVLVRPAGVSVTVSAADAAIREEDSSALARRAWSELRQAALAFALPGDWPEAPPPWRVVKERRATPRHTAGEAWPPPPRKPLRNLALAGDWTWPALPATIEAAIRSGTAAAGALRG